MVLSSPHRCPLVNKVLSPSARVTLLTARLPTYNVHHDASPPTLDVQMKHNLKKLGFESNFVTDTHRLLSCSFLGLPYRILGINHKNELLRSLWVSQP